MLNSLSLKVFKAEVQWQPIRGALWVDFSLLQGRGLNNSWGSSSTILGTNYFQEVTFQSLTEKVEGQ